jgi:outer membrane protein assembly factor BamE (lipoprotein component of BamABCDE complex)
MKPDFRLAVCGLALTVAACVPVVDQARDVNTAQGTNERLTLGTVQKEIRVGMSGAEVVAALGSPNVVTTDEVRRETWVYDRIATEQAYSSSAGGVNILFLGGVGGRSGVSQTSQRTLTVIIRYDASGKVRDFSYRSSSF